MDIKSKKSRPLAAWLCFFLGLSIFGGLIFTGLATVMAANGDWQVLSTPFAGYRNTQAFKQQTNDYFSELMSLADTPVVEGTVDEQTVQNQLNNRKSVQDYLNREGTNLKYYADNSDINLVFKNMEVDLPLIPNWGISGYTYIWYYDGQKIQVWDHGKQVDTQRLDSGYQNTIVSNYQDTSSGVTNGRVLLAVKDTLVKNPYGHSTYYQEQQFLSVIGWVYLALAIAGVGLLVFAIIRRRDKKDFERKLASWSKDLWFEVKAFFSLLLLFLLTNVSLNLGGRNDPLEWFFWTSFISCCILFVLWWFYLMLLDLITNRKEFFTHNIVNSLITWYRSYERKYPWQKGLLKRAYMLVAVESVLVLLSVILLVSSIDSSTEILFPVIMLVIVAIGIYLLYRYLKDYNQTLSDFGKLTDQIELIKNGEMNSRLELADDSTVYLAVENLNAIQEGMQTALVQMIKSERMKIDLITNVSHDLKTPLTSIISYVDLLTREEDLPEHVNDYIKILVQKSERLKNLIQDLFDLSKASSGNAALDMETLDLPRLIKQTLADMQEPIDESGLAFRLNIPDEPVYIVSDGKKLYRVWENLIANALKYSLPGSRVFVDLTVEGEKARAVMKNIANYEMDFVEDEILQRFVRGDSSRNTEGSGLGLSIAQQFTQICGGNFEIKIDGDLFKVEMVFSVVSQYASISDEANK